MTAADPLSRRLAVLAAVLLTCLWLGLTAAPPASAHGEDGYFEDLRVETTAGLEVTVDAVLLYEGDDDPAPGATVTLVAEGPQGQVVGPVPMEEGTEPGRYQGTTTLPAAGTWELRLSSLDPDGVLRSPLEVSPPGEDESTSPAETSGTADPTEPTAPATATPAPATAEPPTPGAMAVEATSASTRATSVGTWAAAGAALVLVGAAVWLAVARRR